MNKSSAVVDEIEDLKYERKETNRKFAFVRMQNEQCESFVEYDRVCDMSNPAWLCRGQPVPKDLDEI